VIEEQGERIKMARMLPIEERKALKELLDAAVTRSDAGSIVSRPLPSETMSMLMLVHLKTEFNGLEERLEECCRFVSLNSGVTQNVKRIEVQLSDIVHRSIQSYEAFSCEVLGRNGRGQDSRKNYPPLAM
jgi:hypothetical protein